MRTTSSVESFNHVLNQSISKRPNFFKFVQMLRFVESQKTDEMFDLANNTIPAHLERRKKRDQEREKKIRALTQDLKRRMTDEKIKSFLIQVAEENGNQKYE